MPKRRLFFEPSYPATKIRISYESPPLDKCELTLHWHHSAAFRHRWWLLDAADSKWRVVEIEHVFRRCRITADHSMVDNVKNRISLNNPGTLWGTLKLASPRWLKDI